MFRLIFVVSVLCPVGAFAQVAEPECAPAGAPDPLAADGGGVRLGNPSLGTVGFTMGGLRFRVRDGAPTGELLVHPHVRRVLCDGPAHRAGIRVGDELVEIEGVDARTLRPLRRVPNERYHFKFRRDDEEFEVTLQAVRRNNLPVATVAKPSLWQAVHRPRIEIGSVFDNSFSLYRIVEVALLADGGFVVGNDGTSELLVFGPEGEFRQAIGRRGTGPGEFMQIGAIGRGSNDSLFVFDPRIGRISVFDSSGELARTAVVGVPIPTMERPANGAPLSAGGWAAGRLVTWREVRDTPTELPDSSPLVRELRAGLDVVRSQRPAAELLFFNEDGTLLGQAGDLLAPEQVSLTQTEWGSGGSLSMTVGRLKIPFQKTLEAAAAWDVVAVGNTDSYEVRILSPDGQDMATIRRSTGPREVPDGYRERWIRGEVAAIDDPGARRERQQLIETVDFPATLPAFRSLAVQEGGRVWVEDYRMPEDEEGPSTWQVYDLDGRHFGEAVLPAGFRLFLITRDSAIGVWKDELEVEYVHVYALDRIEG